jgi:cytochrome c-type biogenesis protein
MFDISIGGAVLAGLLSFLSPCVLPMVPFYLSYLAGAGVEQIASGGTVSRALRLRSVLAAVFFAAGVITIFVALGASASAFGQIVRDWFGVLRWIAAAVIIAMGLHFLGVIRIGILYRQLRSEPGDVANLSLAGAYVIGLAFAFGWTPCVGPVLAAILFTAAGTDTAERGAMLLLGYGLGMTLPFVVAAMFIGPFMRWMAGFRRHLGTVEKAMGLLLIVFGVLIATNSVNYIAQWLIETFPIFGVIG